MDLILFLKGIGVGFVIAAPVGPVGLLCAHRTLHNGIASGLWSGFGAAVADAIFGVIAAFGLSFIAHLMLEHETWMRLGGGVILLVIGAVTITKHLTATPETVIRHNPISDSVSTFVLTITNPITILSFAPVFAAADAVVAPGELVRAWTLIVGVFLGSALWWSVLCAGASVFRGAVSDENADWIGRISGVLIVVAGALVIISVTPWGRALFGIADRMSQASPN